MNYNDGIEIVVADSSHEKYVDTILETITASAKKRGSGIATRTHEYLTTKMRERKAIIALSGPEKEFAGFCYIESWGNKEYVANSGLIVVEKFRNHHLATRIKEAAFTLSRLRWPHAKLFGLTSQAAVMRCGDHRDLHCINCDILARTGRKYCVCTAMLYDPNDHIGEPLPVEFPPDVVEMAKKAAESDAR